jgi:transcriptional regulator, XRE family
MLEILDDNEWNKSELGRRAGVSKSVMIRATVYGIMPNVSVLIKLADCLDIPMLYLLGESDDKVCDKSENPTNFHTRLEQLTTEKHTTFCKIANSMPFPDSYLYDWMRKKVFPSPEFLKPIAEYFKVSLDYLLGRTDYRD